MIITVEISNYPLTVDYEPIILDFINRCIDTGIKVKVNATSTHLQGEYNVVMSILTKEIETSFKKNDQNIFVIKLLKGELNLDFKL